MYICLCRGVTDRQIKAAIDDGAQTLSHLRKNLGVAGQCGKCACSAQELLDAAKGGDNNQSSLFYAIAS
jgi:bacterioferritin-associated ferredoxin